MRLSEKQYILSSPATLAANVSELDICSDTRIGHVQRRKAIDHIETMLKEGYLTGDEAGARVSFINKAVIANQLAAASIDLPAARVPRKRLANFVRSLPDWDNPRVYIPVLIGLIMLFTIFTIEGGILTSHHPETTIDEMIGVPLCFIGILGIITSVFGLWTKAIGPPPKY